MCGWIFLELWIFLTYSPGQLNWPSLKWVPGNVLESNNSRHVIEHITYPAPSGVYKYGVGNIYLIHLKVWEKVLYLLHFKTEMHSWHYLRYFDILLIMFDLSKMVLSDWNFFTSSFSPFLFLSSPFSLFLKASHLPAFLAFSLSNTHMEK